MGGGAMGFFVVAVILAAAIVVCLVPLIVVLVWRQARRKLYAWVLASVPLLALVTYCLVLRADFDRQHQMVIAAANGNRAEVKRLLDAGVSPDSTNMDGSEAINAAILGYHWDVVRLLVDAGAHDADVGDDNDPRHLSSGMLEEAGQKDLADVVRRRGHL